MQNNHAGLVGMYCSSGATSNIKSSTIQSNMALGTDTNYRGGGGIYAHQDTIIKISNSYLLRNKASRIATGDTIFSFKQSDKKIPDI